MLLGLLIRCRSIARSLSKPRYLLYQCRAQQVRQFTTKSDSHLPKTMQLETDSYALGMTCKSCTHRMHKMVSKHAYHKGVVIVTCPNCQERHLVADNLGWFGDQMSTAPVVNLETMAAANKESVKRSASEASPLDLDAIVGLIDRSEK